MQLHYVFCLQLDRVLQCTLIVKLNAQTSKRFLSPDKDESPKGLRAPVAIVSNLCRLYQQATV